MHQILSTRKISNFHYICDRKPHLLSIQRELNEIYFGLVDPTNSIIGKIGVDVSIEDQFSVYIPKKHRQGGQSQMRFQRLRSEALNNYHSILGQKLHKILHNSKKLILLGGNFVNLSLFRNYLKKHSNLERKIAGSYSLEYSGEMGIRELLQKSQKDREEICFFKQENLMERYIAEFINYPEKFVVGDRARDIINTNRFKSGLVLKSRQHAINLTKKITIIEIKSEKSDFIQLNCNGFLVEL